MNQVLAHAEQAGPGADDERQNDARHKAQQGQRRGMRMRNAFGIGHDAELPQAGKLYLDGLAADTPLDAVLVAERASQALQLLEGGIAGFDSVGLVVLADADDTDRKSTRLNSSHL